MGYLPCRPRFRVAYLFVLAVVVSVAGASAISFVDEPMPDAATPQATQKQPLRGVLTREQQAAHTPQTVLDNLLAGNRRSVANDLTQRNHSQRIREANEGQFPKAVILSCLDSRIPVEDVFDLGIGDIFVARVAEAQDPGDEAALFSSWRTFGWKSISAAGTTGKSRRERA